MLRSNLEPPVTGTGTARVGVRSNVADMIAEAASSVNRNCQKRNRRGRTAARTASA